MTSTIRFLRLLRRLDRRGRSRAPFLAVACALVAGACGYAPTGYAAAPLHEAAGVTIDPVGDTLGAGLRQWDITRLAVTQQTDSTVVELDLTATVITRVAGDSTGLLGFIDFDIDQDSTTGRQSAVDSYRHDGGSSGMRAEYTIVLGNVAPDSSMSVADVNFRSVGRVKPRIDGARLTFRVPNALIGAHAGLLNASAVVGATGGPSDFAPNTGHLATHD
ncbi:MAG: hypothetical protein HY275_16880 [Gemmatimonadetes bacterium]|nr:hypothetical protein [Gemmatimonadota bacterium]